MNKFVPVAASLLLAATLAACAPGVNTPGQRLTFDSNGLVVHARGEPDAHVTAAGDLRIDDRSIAVTAAQRELLQRYYRQASAAMASGAAMGKQGVEMAKSGIDNAVASIFQHDTDAAEKKMDAQSQRIEASADALCKQVRAMGDTQVAIAAALPAFKPYAPAGDHARCTYTHTTTIRDNDGHVTTTSTTDDSEANHAAAQPVAQATRGAVESSAAAASQP